MREPVAAESCPTLPLTGDRRHRSLVTAMDRLPDDLDDVTAGELDERRFGALLASARRDPTAQERLIRARRLTSAQLERALTGLSPMTAASLRRLRALWIRLSIVDGVEVLELTDGDELRTGERRRWGVLARTNLDETVARRAVALFARLPYATQMRCHTPGYGLRLSAAGAEIAAVALCFQCNNASIWMPEGEAMLTFDARSAIAQELQELLGAVL